MILFKLKDRLHDRSMNQLTFSKKTGIRYNTVNAYFHGYVKRMRPDDLNKMCEFLECSLTDLVEYAPDKK
ncbi:MAG: helix-turn-helix transcriptional regulator [Clostridiaceae bacterium]